MGKRLYDIEMMKIELERIYDAGLIERMDYLEAERVLRKEHQLELQYLKKNEEKTVLRARQSIERKHVKLDFICNYCWNVRLDGL